ncbi:MAG: hypothetical protein JWL62_3793 [Hyphomicrobiales bacterium]|nr:hypothetical protein [Hyphomicrobiales bacterium]
MEVHTIKGEEVEPLIRSRVIKESGTYELDRQGTSCFRPFVPAPPALERVVDILDKATDSIRLFERRLQEWPDPMVVGRLFARLDAVSSAGAEGSTTTFTDLLEYESSLKTAPNVPDAISVAALAEAAFEEGGADPILLAGRLHRRLFERGGHLQLAEAGEFKIRTNRVVDEDAPNGLFAYTRPESVTEAMREWRDFVEATSPELPELLRHCLGHWMFEHIHPFHDGNGRVGRLLIPVLLRQKGFTNSTCGFASEPVYLDKPLYVDGLKFARASGDMATWTRLMLGFLHQNAQANLGRLDTLLATKARWTEATADARTGSAIHRLVPFALTRPAFTVKDAVAGIGGTFPSVNNAVVRMVELGLLEVAQGARRDRLFQAREVLNAFGDFRVRRRSDTDEPPSAPGMK